MIDDPIKLTGFGPTSWYSLRMDLRGQQLFAISENGFALYFVDINNEGCYSHHFMTIPSRSSPFLIRDNGKVQSSLSREEFVDLMSKNYPDHFEWLLFHPEWTA